MRLFTKYEHGLIEVKIEEIGNKRVFILNNSKKFESFSDFLKFIYKTDKKVNMTFDTYFKTDQETQSSIIESFLNSTPVSNTVIVKGIDLEKRGGEVRKLLYKGFGPYIMSCGFDFEDVLQEVYKGIVIRNRGKGAWDGKKSTFGHYVYLVCSCVVSNYKNKHQKFSLKETSLSFTNSENKGEISLENIASDYIHIDEDEEETLNSFVQYLYNLKDVKEEVRDYAIKVLPYLYKGFKRHEIAKKPGFNYHQVCKAISFLKDNSKDFFI